MKLPIDIVPNTNPPKFVWQQEITTYNGKQTVEHEGMMLPSVESAIVQLIAMTKHLVKENMILQDQLNIANHRANAAETLNSNQKVILDQSAKSGTSIVEQTRQTKPQPAQSPNFRKNK